MLSGSHVHAIGLRLTRGARLSMDVVAGLLLLGVGQGLFLAALLALRPQLRTPANLFLTALVAALALSCLDDVLQRTGVYARAPWVAGWALLLLPLFGPLLRFHFEALVVPGEWCFERRHRRWLVSPVIGLLLAILFQTAPAGVRAAILLNGDVAETTPNILRLLCLIALYGLAAAQQGGALAFGLRLARRARDVDAAAATRLLWLRGLLLIALICWLAYVASLVAGLSNATAAQTSQDLASLLYVLSLYGMGILGLARPDTLLPAPGDIVATMLEPVRAKYAKSALDETDARRIVGKIVTALERDKPYLDSGLTLPRLAAAVGASTNDTSQAINSQLGGSFYDLVNRMRIEEAKRRLLDFPDQSALEICFAVGFNSKSVFNAAFKRWTGTTPSAFRAANGSAVAPHSSGKEI